MTRYMVIKNYREGCFDKIYERFHKNGRMLPHGLYFIESWLEKTGKRCFQLMETDNPETFETQTKNWADLVDFDIVELGEKPSTDNFQK